MLQLFFDLLLFAIVLLIVIFVLVLVDRTSGHGARFLLPRIGDPGVLITVMLSIENASFTSLRLLAVCLGHVTGI